MTAFAEVGDRVRGALGGTAIVSVIQVISRVLMDVSEVTANPGTFAAAQQATLTSLNTLPGFLNLGGAALSFGIAGPFGLIGYALETMGASLFFNGQPDAGLKLASLGALVVVGGHFVWGAILDAWAGRGRGF